VVDDVLHGLALGCLIEEDLVAVCRILEGDHEIVPIVVFVDADLLLLVGVISVEGLHRFIGLNGVEDEGFSLSFGELIRIHHFLEEVGVGDDVFGAEGGIDGREGAVFKLVRSFLIDLIHRNLSEAALHIVAAVVEGFFGEGTVVEVVDDGLEVLGAVDCQFLHGGIDKEDQLLPC
jgi:hypothetical protein